MATLQNPQIPGIMEPIAITDTNTGNLMINPNWYRFFQLAIPSNTSDTPVVPNSAAYWVVFNPFVNFDNQCTIYASYNISNILYRGTPTLGYQAFFNVNQPSSENPAVISEIPPSFGQPATSGAVAGLLTNTVYSFSGGDGCLNFNFSYISPATGLITTANYTTFDSVVTLVGFWNS